MKKSVNLDILRIIAALMVLSVHAGRSAGFSFEVGARGVELFFIMSGYLAFVSLEKNPGAIGYYKKRAVRIIPLYYSCLILLWIVNMVEAMLNDGMSAALQSTCGLRYLRYFVFAHMLIPSENYLLYNGMSALWTMSSFAFFYLMAPWLKRGVKDFNAAVIGLALAWGIRSITARIIVSLLSEKYPPEGHIDWFSSNNPLGQMYCFMMGIVIYYALKESREAFWVFVLTVALVLTDMHKYQWVLFFPIVFIVAIKMRDVIETEKAKWISWISNGTFALYLIHPIVFKVDGLLMDKYKVDHVLIRACILYTTAILVAYLFYYGLIVKLESRIYKKVFKE